VIWTFIVFGQVTPGLFEKADAIGLPDAGNVARAGQGQLLGARERTLAQPLSDRLPEQLDPVRQSVQHRALSDERLRQELRVPDLLVLQAPAAPSVWWLGLRQRELVEPGQNR